MKFNSYMIKDLLCRHISFQMITEHLHSDRLSASLRSVQLYQNTKTVIKDDHVYIISAELWNDIPLSLKGTYLIWDWNDTCSAKSDCDYIGFQGISSPEDLLLAVQSLFVELQDWETALYEIAIKEGDMKRMGDISLDFFTNPLCLYTASLQNIFACERKKAPQLMLFKKEDIYQYLLEDEIESLRFNPTFIKTIDQTVPSIFPDEVWGYRILYDNIRKDGIYIARLMLCEVERPIRDSDHYLLRHLANIMYSIIERQNWAINSHIAFLDDTLLQLLRGEYIDFAKLDSIFRHMGWNLDNSFFCVKVALSEEDEKMNTITALCTKLETTISNSISIHDGDYLFILCNLTKSNADREQITSTLITILREQLLHAGISMPFDGIKNLPLYYQQAHNALLIGEKEDPTFWYYRYEHYEYSHLLKNALGAMTIESICPIGLQKLMRYDKLHNHQYTHALKTYLEENMSVTATIKRLYIQKSTFVYQLKRIYEITGVNFENKEIRLLYLIVFQIMEREARFTSLTS